MPLEERERRVLEYVRTRPMSTLVEISTTIGYDKGDVKAVLNEMVMKGVVETRCVVRNRKENREPKKDMYSRWCPGYIISANGIEWYKSFLELFK